MEIKSTLILEGTEPLSKALEAISENGTAAVITRNRVYFGIVDDRHLRMGLRNPNKTRCDSACVKAPALKEDSTLEEKLNMFLSGHFKALPVVNGKGKPLGIYTRADLLRELLELRVVPKDYAYSLMTSPVITIQYDAAVGTVKRIMKENNVNHLVVVRSGRPVGVISMHDLAASLMVPKTKEKRAPISERTNPNEMPVSNFMREEFASISDMAMLDEAVRKMAEGNLSSLVVESNGKLKGVVSATNVFKKTLELFSEEPQVLISGLGEEESRYYNDIKGSILHVINKFAKSFPIDAINMHFKKGKSVYNVQAHMKVENTPLSMRAEDYSFSGVINAITKEMYNVLVKKKSRNVDKKIRKKLKGMKGEEY